MPSSEETLGLFISLWGLHANNTTRVVSLEIGNFLKFPAKNVRKFILIFPEVC